MPYDATTGDGNADRRIDKELLSEAVFIMLAAAFLYAVTFTFEDVPPILAQGIQPTIFPRSVIIVMFLLAAIQAVKAIRLSPRQIAELKPHKPIPRIVYLTAILMIAFFIVMPIVGTFPTLIIFCPALALLWGERRWFLMAGSFAAFIAALYGLFILALGVPLP